MIKGIHHISMKCGTAEEFAKVRLASRLSFIWSDNHSDLDSRLKEILNTSKSILEVRTDFEI